MYKVEVIYLKMAYHAPHKNSNAIKLEFIKLRGIMSAIGQRPPLTPDQVEQLQRHEAIVKSGNEDWEHLGQEMSVWSHELMVKALYVQRGLVHLKDGIEILEGKNERDGFNRLFKEKIYPDEAFYEVLLTRLYPDEEKILSKDELSKRYTEYSPGTLPLAQVVQKLAQTLIEGDVQLAAHIIYQLPAIVNENNEEGIAPLFWVAASKKISDVATHRLMQILIDHGAEGRTKAFFDGKEVTPLYLACTNEKQWSARLLIRYQTGSGDLQEFEEDANATRILLLAWGNSGRPECPQSEEINEARRRLNEESNEKIREAIAVLESVSDEVSALRKTTEEKQEIGEEIAPSSETSAAGNSDSVNIQNVERELLVESHGSSLFPSLRVSSLLLSRDRAPSFRSQREIGHLSLSRKEEWGRYQEVDDVLRDRIKKVAAIGTLFSDRGNSGGPECPLSEKINEVYNRLNEEFIRESILSGPVNIGTIVQVSSAASFSPVSNSSPPSDPSTESAPVSEEVVGSMDKGQNDTAKKASLLARLVIGALVGGLVGWFVGLRRAGVIASSAIGAILGITLFQMRFNRSLLIS